MTRKEGEAELAVRSYGPADFDQLIDIQRECFPPPYPQEQLWSREQLCSHVERFPAGALCVDAKLPDGRHLLVGSSTSLIVQWSPSDPAHSWSETTADGFISTHNPRGNSLYGVDVAVRPSWRGRGIARLMYEARFALVERLGLERFMAGGRMPGYHKHRASMTPQQYAAAVVRGELADPVVTPQLRSGLEFVTVVYDYLPDEESANCAALLEWRSPARRQ